jgi:hypothetical protein
MSQQPNTFLYENLFYDESDPNQPKPPYLHGDYWLVNGEIKKWNGPVANVTSPIFIKGKNEPVRIGTSFYSFSFFSTHKDSIPSPLNIIKNW